MTPLKACQHAFSARNISFTRRSSGGSPLGACGWSANVVYFDDRPLSEPLLDAQGDTCAVNRNVAIVLSDTRHAAAPALRRAAPLRPFEASYAFIWNGITAGISTFTLRQDVRAGVDLCLAQSAPGTGPPVFQGVLDPDQPHERRARRRAAAAVHRHRSGQWRRRRARCTSTGTPIAPPGIAEGKKVDLAAAPRRPG